MEPLEEPSTTFSREEPWSDSLYFANNADRNEIPYDMDADGRIKDPEHGILYGLVRPIPHHGILVILHAGEI